MVNGRKMSSEPNKFLSYRPISSNPKCYDLKSLEWDNKTTLVLSNTRKLDGVLSTK